MLSSKMIDLLTKQIGAEFHNSNIYFTIAHKFKRAGLPSISKYYLKQADEERGHGVGIAEYLSNKLIDFVVPDIPEAPREPDSSVYPLELVNWLADIPGLEEETTTSINIIMNLAILEKDNETADFIQDYVREQVSEVFEAETILSEAKLVNGNLLILDMFFKETLLGA